MMRQNVCGMFIAKRGGTTTGELARDARCLRNGDPGIKLGVVEKTLALDRPGPPSLRNLVSGHHSST
ncbi:MAG: hypothetical protein JO066_02115 [Verrucomicrobia bacterium]|nr:hypothetical protein [Verrucomicrobiota bacterium]